MTYTIIKELLVIQMKKGVDIINNQIHYYTIH